MDHSQALAAWISAGSRTTLCGFEVFVRTAAAAGKPPLLLHGYPTASFDFRRLWPALAERYRELVPGADVVLFEGVGHYPHLEDHAAVLAAYFEFRAATVQPTQA
jgi:pimeloyl-ACP methyl ester carboxylesterase